MADPKGASDRRTTLVRLRIPILDRGGAQILGSQWWAGRGAGCTQGKVLASAAGAGLVVFVLQSIQCAPQASNSLRATLFMSPPERGEV